MSYGSHLTSEMTRCRGELKSKESELKRLRRDVSVRTSQMSHMEENLQHVKIQLESKSDIGVMDNFSYISFFVEKRHWNPERNIECDETAFSDHLIVWILWFNHCSQSYLFNLSFPVVDLEEKLHRCEADRLNCVHRVQILEEQLQAARGELVDTLEQLRQLKDVLQRTHTIADERQASVEKLTVQLRWGYAAMWNTLLHTGTNGEPHLEETSICWSSD